MVINRNQRVHVTLKNDLPKLTTHHWQGMEIPETPNNKNYQTPIYPGEEKQIEFTVNQPAALTWLHTYPCPATVAQGWMGLAMNVVITDQNETKMAIPKKYGIDEFPIILQDRIFHHNQLNYRSDYNPRGVLGNTPLINGTIKPYIDVTTQKILLLFLGGSNRREWRLHFANNLVMTQIAGDDSFLPHPVKLTKILVTSGERIQVIVDFKNYHNGDRVALYTDDFKLIEFRIHKFAPDNSTIPHLLFEPKIPTVNKNLQIRKIMISANNKATNRQVALRKMKQPLSQAEYWDVTNPSTKTLHPFHLHGTHFTVVSRNGKRPFPNEDGYKDTIPVRPDETVRLRVEFPLPGVFMYYCQNAGMMSQIEIFDPRHPQHYKINKLKTNLFT